MSGCAHVVKLHEFSSASQIPLLQTTGRDEQQCRGTICEVSSLENRCIFLSLYMSTECIIYALLYCDYAVSLLWHNTCLLIKS